LHYIAHRWGEETGEPSYQPTHPDVHVLTEHPHPVEELVDTRTGLPWLQKLESAGGHGGNHHGN